MIIILRVYYVYTYEPFNRSYRERKFDDTIGTVQNVHVYPTKLKLGVYRVAKNGATDS